MWEAERRVGSLAPTCQFSSDTENPVRPRKAHTGRPQLLTAPAQTQHVASPHSRQVEIPPPIVTWSWSQIMTSHHSDSALIQTTVPCELLGGDATLRLIKPRHENHLHLNLNTCVNIPIQLKQICNYSAVPLVLSPPPGWPQPRPPLCGPAASCQHLEAPPGAHPWDRTHPESWGCLNREEAAAASP